MFIDIPEHCAELDDTYKRRKAEEQRALQEMVDARAALVPFEAGDRVLAQIRKPGESIGSNPGWRECEIVGINVSYPQRWETGHDGQYSVVFIVRRVKVDGELASERKQVGEVRAKS